MLEINNTLSGLNRGFKLNVLLNRNVNKFIRPLIKYAYILCVELSSRAVVSQVSFERKKKKTINGKCASEFIKLQLLVVLTVGPCF